MEWLKALLEKATLKDGKLDIDALMEAIKTEFPKNAVPKAEFNTLNDTKKTLEAQIAERDTQLTELNKKVKGNEELEKTIADLQTANATTKTEYETKLKDITINSAIQSKLTDTKYADLLLGKFDKTKLSVAADGKVVGIDEQLVTIKETYKDLFVPVVKGKDPFNKEKTPTGGKNPWSKEHFNLTEQGKMLKENPELAKQYMQNYVPEFLTDILEFNLIYEIENKELDEIYAGIEKLKGDMFIRTASNEMILRLENFLRIKGMGTLEQRKNYLLTLFQKGKKLNEGKIKEVTNTIVGADCLVTFFSSDELNNPEPGCGILRVQVLSPEKGKDYRYDDIFRTLKPSVPGHIKLLVIKYFALWEDVKNNFSDWNTVKAMTDWQAVKSYIPPQ